MAYPCPLVKPSDTSDSDTSDTGGPAMLHWLQTAFSTYVLHVEHGNGYQWHSGFGSDLGQYTVVGAVIGAAKHKNCHHKGCWRIGHYHPDHGWPSCRHHYSETPEHAKH